jgi:hypothetical protein
MDDRWRAVVRMEQNRRGRSPSRPGSSTTPRCGRAGSCPERARIAEPAVSQPVGPPAEPEPAPEPEPPPPPPPNRNGSTAGCARQHPGMAGRPSGSPCQHGYSRAARRIPAGPQQRRVRARGAVAGVPSIGPPPVGPRRPAPAPHAVIPRATWLGRTGGGAPSRRWREVVWRALPVPACASASATLPDVAAPRHLVEDGVHCGRPRHLEREISPATARHRSPPARGRLRG